MTLPDSNAVEAARLSIIGNPLNDEQIRRMVAAYITALPDTKPTEGAVTDAMVRAAEAAVYLGSERVICQQMVDPIDMRKALEAALRCRHD